MSNLQIYPYINRGEGWSISDSAMAAIWIQLEIENKVEKLFYDGSIKDVSEWLSFVKQPGVFLSVVADPEKGIPVHIFWLKDIEDGKAWVHYAALGKYRRGAWETIIDYWKTFELRILLGLTPETNQSSVKFIKNICKATIVGTIPKVCNLYYEKKRVGGVISYFLLQEEDEKWEETPLHGPLEKVTGVEAQIPQ